MGLNWLNFSGRKLRSGKVLSQQVRNESRKDQLTNQTKNQSSRRLRNGKTIQSPNQNQNLKANLKNPKTMTETPRTSSNSNHNQVPLPSQRPNSPIGITGSNLKRHWTDLNQPLSYSGNSAAILNQIKSFKLVYVFYSCIKYWFSVHKPKKNNFKRRHVVVPNINHSVMADLGRFKLILC